MFVITPPIFPDPEIHVLRPWRPTAIEEEPPSTMFMDCVIEPSSVAGIVSAQANPAKQAKKSMPRAVRRKAFRFMDYSLKSAEISEGKDNINISSIDE